MSFEQAVRIPLERVGAVIGRDGATKKSLEAELGIKLGVDSREGLVTIKSDSVDQGDPFIAVRIIEAIGRGFSPQRAKRLLEEGVAFEVIDLRDFSGRSANSLDRIRGRVIGLKGKSRRVIEESDPVPHFGLWEDGRNHRGGLGGPACVGSRQEVGVGEPAQDRVQ